MAAEVVRLTDAETGATADVLVSLGFNCFSWRSTFVGEEAAEPRELLWAEPGFADGDKRESRSGIPLLAPFAGRISGGAYEWEGKHYQIEPNDGLGNAIHGFALRAPWRVTDQQPDAVTAEFRPTLDAPETAGLWPSDYRLTATYRIAAGRLDFEFTAENLGDERLPFGLGTHAYFRLPLIDDGDAEATEVIVPVEAEWKTEGLIPTGEATPIGADHPLRSGAPLGGREFDTPFSLSAGARATDLIDPKSGRTVRQTFDESLRFAVLYVPDHREAICLEPYTCLPNPFELEAAGVDSGLRVIEPGASYRTTVTLEAIGGGQAIV